ncbi:hypothetical protein FRC02_001124 [Tulasnella sp. 418]|nr:hypothetical protein FRC02_001124 [Tulasnella sp. 418]
MKSRKPTTSQDNDDIPSYRAPPVPPKFGYGLQYWSDYLDLAQAYDKEFAGGLHTQLDSLLTFAGLFSGINTGFIVLSLGLLNPTPVDQTNALLRILLSQHNVSMAILDEASQQWTLKPVGVRSSYFLSASLSCGLLTLVGAILGKQWLAYYERSSEVGNLEERVVKHQNLTDGLDTYSVRALLYSLSILIQFAVVLFLVGFIDYLYDLHRGIALSVISSVCVAGILYIYTVIVATLDPKCPFQTPVSFALRTLLLYLKTFSKSIPPSNHPKSSLTAVNPENRDLISIKSGKAGHLLSMIWMPFIGSQESEPLTQEETERGETDLLMENDFGSYARSVRWILETSSNPKTLLEAAKNLPTLQDVRLTQQIFMQIKVEGGLLIMVMHFLTSCALKLRPGKPAPPTTMISYSPSKSSIIFDDSLAYSRLISLFSGSLDRYLASYESKDLYKDVIDDVIVYGRAVCHTLITSPGSVEAFKRLSDRLVEFSSLAWLQGVKGELLLLLMCTVNHSRFWLNPEQSESSIDEIDISALPIYITGISLASLTPSATKRAEWVLKMAHRSLSKSSPSPSPRIIGLAAKSLVYLIPGNFNKVLSEFWGAYSSEADYVSNVLSAFRLYFLNVETVPECVGAYTALLKALVTATKELYDVRDYLYSPEVRIKRTHYRRDLRNYGPGLLAVLEKILIDASNRIRNSLSEPNMSVPFTSPSLHGIYNRHHFKELCDEILQTIKDGVLNHHWGSYLTLSGMALWKVAAILEPSSDILPVLLELMRNVDEDQTRYIDLFHSYPSVVSLITLALKDVNPIIREGSIALLHDKAKVWFKDPSITQSFAEAGLDTSLASHVKMGNNMHQRVLTVVGALGIIPGWRIKLLDAFYNIAVSIDSEDLADQTLRNIIQCSLDVWFELRQASYHSDSEEIDRNWHSKEMMGIVSRYVLQRVEVYEAYDLSSRVQLLEVGITPSLQEYVKICEEASLENPRVSQASQEVVEVSRRLVSLLAKPGS